MIIIVNKSLKILIKEKGIQKFSFCKILLLYDKFCKDE
jgi:hypothetical protein